MEKIFFLKSFGRETKLEFIENLIILYKEDYQSIYYPGEFLIENIYLVSNYRRSLKKFG